MVAQPDSTAPLSSAQRARLHELERVVEKGLDSFLACGKALMEVRDQKLFRENYDTFEQYCRERWGLSRSRGQEIIRSTVVAQNLLDAPGATNGEAPLPPDGSEATLRPLARFQNPELQRTTWQLVNSLGTKPTPSTVARVVRVIRGAIQVAAGDANGKKLKRTKPEETVFLRSIYRLAKIESFSVQ